ncbi:MAG: hypothetical protein ACRED9_05035 [Caulobacteraceae bacterium]
MHSKISELAAANVPGLGGFEQETAAALGEVGAAAERAKEGGCH